jgi:hypothetical protein
MTLRFGMKCGWLAVPAGDPAQVLAQVREGGLGEPTASAWDDGVRRAGTEEITFATAPVRGWVLVVGGTIMYEAVHSIEARVERLSRAFGEAQAFVSDRITGHYRWVRAVGGELVRSFATIDGHVLRDDGADDASPSGEPDEHQVLRIAAAWSVDPTALRDDECVAGLAASHQWFTEWQPPVAIEIGAVASRKEATLHALGLVRQGCPRCHAARVESRADRDLERAYRYIVQCEACGAHLHLEYTAGAGWDDQPGPWDPRLTNLHTPSELVAPAALLEYAERNAALAREHDGVMATSFACSALGALDELEKHRDFTIPDPAAYRKLVAWLRAMIA